MKRNELLELLTTKLLGFDSNKPVLVAIEGRSAAGKSTLAHDLASGLRAHGRPVLESSIDRFHPPGHKYRSQDRRYTPESYYAEGYDYDAFRAYLLDPVRRGDQRCRLAYWDSFNDAAFPEEWTEIAHGAIVLVDGAFLLRPDLRTYWDYTIWLNIGWDTMVERAAKRDVAWVGSVEVVIERYRTFWIPMHEFYEMKDQPLQRVHMIIDHTDLDNPVILSRASMETAPEDDISGAVSSC